jgi:uncharacterized heparinase superfamily protein
VLSRVTGGLRRASLRLADSVVTMPILRWTWRGLADDSFGGELPEFRPADREAVRDMMAGRYLLASRLVETGGVSPFSLDTPFADWWYSLHSFSWLRHFQDLRDSGERRFALTLVLDWIGREGSFQRESWAPGLTAQRVLNWLRHLPLLLAEATPEQARTLQRVLGAQIQSLKLRSGLTIQPVDALLAAIALLGAESCEQNEKTDVPGRVERLNAVLAEQLDSDGLHLSRNSRVQLQLLVDLLSIRRVAAGVSTLASSELAAQINRMHEALDALTLGTGEPAYFNGTGQLPHDVLIAIQAQGPGRRPRSRLTGGYGVLRNGPAVLVADSGQQPLPSFNGEAHHSALAMEFSYGNALVLGSCGPAPVGLEESRDLFRQGVAHSAPTIDGEDAPVSSPALRLEAADHLLSVTTSGYARRFGVELERRITLLSEGTTLVGQDRTVGASGTPSGRLSIRFHLAPGVLVRRTGGEGVVRLVLPTGAVWSFLWEGADLHEEESVRQSAYRGFSRTRQLVLEAPVVPDAEVAWIFTLEQP